MKQKLLLVAAFVLSLGLFATSAQAQTICDNDVNTHDGYTYEYWKDSGTGCMTLGSGGTYSVEWSNIGNLLARTGLRPGSSNQVINYAANYQPNGNSYLCVYGWTTNPLVEYYIVESWGSWRPPGSTSKGTVSIDGGTYDIYETTRTQQPSIEGTQTFQQYWSVRTSTRSSGTIHVGQHFSAWANYGMNMGSLYEVSFCVEGYQSSGSADVYSMSMSEGDDDDDDDDSVTSAFSTIEAEYYDSTTSSTIEAIGTDTGNGIGYIESGDTITFNNVDFGSGVNAFSARVASEQSSSIEVRIGSSSGTLLGTLSNVSTGSWDTYQSMSTSISSVTGVQDLVLVFSGPVNIDSFVFTASSSGDDDDDDDDDNGSSLTVPGRIEAEDYTSMSGIEVEDCGEGTSNLGYIDQGDWMEYQVNVQQSGTYTISYRLASQASAATFSCQVNGSVQHSISVPNTGDWQTYQTSTGSLSLSAGTQTIRLVSTGSDYWNINWLDLQLNSSGDDDDDDDNGTSISAFSTIEAENYNSTTSSTIEVIGTSSGSGIGYIESGDTITFNNVDFGSGVASFSAVVASSSSSSIEVRIGSSSGTLLGTLSDVSTGDWDTYQTKSANISSVTGVQNLVLVFSGAVNVDSFVFSTSSSGDDDDDDDYTGGKLIALTFDDGPNTSITPQVLDKLEQNGVVASFFLVGQNVNSGVQAVMQRQLNLGCEINNHSYTHSDMTSMASWEIQQEISNTNNAIYQQVGVTPAFFRPPYISVNNTMYEAIDLPFINGINCNDWDDSVSASTRAQTIINNAQDGDIVLLHDYDGNYNTVSALDSMIQGLKNNGFTFVTVSRLFELKGVNPNQEYKIWSNTSN